MGYADGVEAINHLAVNPKKEGNKKSLLGRVEEEAPPLTSAHFKMCLSDSRVDLPNTSCDSRGAQKMKGHPESVVSSSFVTAKERKRQTTMKGKSQLYGYCNLRLRVKPPPRLILWLLVSSSSDCPSKYPSMRVLLASLALLIGTSHAFQARSTQHSVARQSMSMTATKSESVPFTQPERVIHENLPVVYVYDHCPFCVRVRFALGLKNVKHNVNFMANDDVPTPSVLVGKKIAPIFQWSEADVCMAESLDIIDLVDSDERFGAPGLFRPATDRTDIKAWQKSVRDLLRVLQRPRYVETGLLPEFQQYDARRMFILNHQMPPYEKADWRANIPEEERLQIYADAMARDPADDVEELNRKLVELDDIIFSDEHCSPGGLSYDDIDLFSRLRSITIIKDVIWPAKLRSYMDKMSKLGDVPLYDAMAM